jgi:hypothetical protein
VQDRDIGCGSASLLGDRREHRPPRTPCGPLLATPNPAQTAHPPSPQVVWTANSTVAHAGWAALWAAFAPAPPESTTPARQPTPTPAPAAPAPAGAAGECFGEREARALVRGSYAVVDIGFESMEETLLIRVRRGPSPRAAR